MNDLIDYSRKLFEEKKKMKKLCIIICVIVTLFAFSIGYYVSFVIKDKKASSSNLTKIEEIYDVLKDDWYYGDENNTSTLIDKAIEGMLDYDKDPHTQYKTIESSEGLGIKVSQYKEYFIITDVMSQINIDAGIKVGDVIKSIDGNSLANKDTKYLKTLLAGKNTVSLVVDRDGVERTFECYVTIYTPATVFKDFDRSSNYAYVQITKFDKNTGDDLEQYVSEAKSKGYNKLIIDLRDNPGGYITSVVDCADLFLDKDKVVLTTKDKEGNAYSYKTASSSKYDFEEITILINNNSASGAEALSAALNDHLNEKVNLVGVTTYGKGSAQKTIYFSDGTCFHYTYALWYTPNDKNIHGDGVEAEIEYTGKGLHLIDFTGAFLKKNDYGNDVKNLQLILKELNHYTGEVNNFFSEEVEIALKSLQNALGIEQTGELDRLTVGYIAYLQYESKIKSYDEEIQFVLNNYSE